MPAAGSHIKPLKDCRLYSFVDTAYLKGREAAEAARQLCDGGSDIIQLRAKNKPAAEVRRLVEQVLPLTEAAGVGLVINDHWQLAAELGAPLCHLGQEDFFDRGFTHVSQLALGPSKPQIGLSSHTPEQARRAVGAGAVYLGVGPVFSTPTKPGVPAVTLAYVRWAARHIDIPWFAIGGITLENVDQVLEAGARRICVVSAILKAPDITQACQAFKRRLGFLA